MFQSLNKNSLNEYQIVERAIDNLKSYKIKKDDIGHILDLKSDYGNKLIEILINCSIQCEFPVMDNDSVHDLVSSFFDSFAHSQDWIDKAYDQCRKAYKLNKKQSKKAV